MTPKKFFGTVLVAALTLLFPSRGFAFGDSGAFDVRVLLTHSMKAGPTTFAEEWAKQVVLRTSAPAKRLPTTVRASDAAILSDPFLLWTDRVAVDPLTDREVTMLRRFFALGGMLVIDDASATPDGKDGPFGASARKELARILPTSVIVALKPDHVLFRTFYLLNGAEGRNTQATEVEAIVRGTTASVIFFHSNLSAELASPGTDLLTPLETSPRDKRHPDPMQFDQAFTPKDFGGGTDRHHEMAVRFAVNVAMYSLCSNYKDDQVHAPFIMRRRGPVQLP